MTQKQTKSFVSESVLGYNVCTHVYITSVPCCGLTAPSPSLTLSSHVSSICPCVTGERAREDPEIEENNLISDSPSIFSPSPPFLLSPCSPVPSEAQSALWDLGQFRSIDPTCSLRGRAWGLHMTDVVCCGTDHWSDFLFFFSYIVKSCQTEQLVKILHWGLTFFSVLFLQVSLPWTNPKTKFNLNQEFYKKNT